MGQFCGKETHEIITLFMMGKGLIMPLVYKTGSITVSFDF